MRYIVELAKDCWLAKDVCGFYPAADKKKARKYSRPQDAKIGLRWMRKNFSEDFPNAKIISVELSDPLDTL
jgi:hypothetical protein